MRCLRVSVLVPSYLFLAFLNGCARQPESADATLVEEPKEPLTEAEVPAETPPAVTNARMWQAILSGDSTTVATSIAHGADVNLSTSEGINALMLAASTGNSRTIEALLSKGARPNDTTKEHHLTALMFAANACSRRVAEVLIAAQADTKLNDSDKGSAADWAFRGCKDPKEAAGLMEYLYANGASIQPRGDAVGLILAEGNPPPMESLLELARSQFRSE